MDALEIEVYLGDLGLELHAAGVRQPVRLLVVGGAYMLTQLHNRPSTRDVDVVLKDIDDPSTSPLYPSLQAAVRVVAQRHGLPATWLNDVVSDALRTQGVVPEGTLWRSYGPLEAYMPEPEYILALKLLAGRPQDLPDIQALSQQMGVSSRTQAQAVLDRYIPDRQVQDLNQVSATLDLVYP